MRDRFQGQGGPLFAEKNLYETLYFSVTETLY